MHDEETTKDGRGSGRVGLRVAAMGCGPKRVGAKPDPLCILSSRAGPKSLKHDPGQTRTHGLSGFGSSPWVVGLNGSGPSKTHSAS